MYIVRYASHIRIKILSMPQETRYIEEQTSRLFVTYKINYVTVIRG
jgi:hypothetical protein